MEIQQRFMMKKLKKNLRIAIKNWKSRDDDYRKIVKISKSPHKAGEFIITLEIMVSVIIESQNAHINDKRSFQTTEQNDSLSENETDIKTFTALTIELDKAFNQKLDKLTNSIVDTLIAQFFKKR